jgi:hypothetical protein
MFRLPAVCLLVSALGALSLKAQPVSLAGEWRFALDREDVGAGERWFNRDLADRIALPGILQAQGYGDEISVDTPWVLSLHDQNWDLREDYRAYTNAGNVKVPFVSQPERHYLGVAWYQRDIEIPTNWMSRRVELFLERTRWESSVWVDDRKVGSCNSLVAPHEYDLGVLEPGRHRLSIRVDNRMLMNYRPDAHAVSDSLGSTWNGVVGRIELRDTPMVWIETLDVVPNPAKGAALVRGSLSNATDRVTTNALGFCILDRFDARLRFPTTNLTVICPPGSVEFEAEVTNSSPTVPWDEFTPRLYEVTAMLNHGGLDRHGLEEREVRRVQFGFRNFGTEGREFVINGRKTHLRGTHHGGDFPLTGYPPCDVEYWLKLFRTCKEWGLNHVRFHSFCPPEAAFTAADEIGIYLQPEPGMWNEISPGTPMEEMLYLETERMIRAYGNHPSFTLMSASNEAKGRWKESLTKWVQHFRKLDPRRLYTPDTGWSLIDDPEPVADRVDYLAVHRVGPRLMRGDTGWFGRDYSKSYEGVDVPNIVHENGQWCAYPDYEVINKFTGFIRPGNYEIFRDSLAARGLLHKNKDFARASGRFQLACYKEEIEANLRTAGLGGFQLLDLHDYMGQGTALVGVLDPFWEEKGYVTAKEWRQFCNATVPLARLPERVLTTSDKFEVPVAVAHYGESALTNAHVSWEIVDAGANVVARGEWPAQTLAMGRSPNLGSVALDLAGLAAPAQYRLAVKVAQDSGPAFENSWDFWLYPQTGDLQAPSDVLWASSWSDAEEALARGGKVLLQPSMTDLDWSSPPLDRLPIFWNRLMNPGWGRMLGLWCDTNHPALAGFPTEANCDWQWTSILRGVRAMNLDRLPESLQPIVQAIDDWNRNWKLGVVYECKVGPGRLLVCTINIEDDLDRRPVARQLRRSLLLHMASDAFQPAVEVSAEQFREVLFDTRIMSRLGAKVDAAGSNPGALVDGDPNTYWLVGAPARGARPVPHPHTVTLTFRNPVEMEGVVFMNRQNDRNHQGDIREYRLEASDDGEQWREIMSGELVSTWDPQTIRFGRRETASHLRLTALSGFAGDPSAALSELAVLHAGGALAETDAGPVEYQRVRSTSTDVEEGN